MKLRMSYHRFNNVIKLLNIELATKIVLLRDFTMVSDRECNCSLLSKVNGNTSTDLNTRN